MDTTAVYAEITKHERDANGDLLVYGRATGPDLDLDKQVCDSEWLAEAMPFWMSTGGNVREQHSAIAAGVGQEIKQLPDGGWDLKALVVDPVSARKVERGVLKGYSIGIRNPQVVKDAAAPGGRICGGSIVEISLVDRPANPSCTLTLAKALKPGPQTASAIDAERHLIKVEELHDSTAEVLDALKALDVEIAKGDEGRDIANADRAIGIIARLIKNEAECLANGMASEACDIELLLSAVRSLEWFKCQEKKEPAMAHVELSAQPEATAPAPVVEKAAEPAPATPVVEKAAEPVVDEQDRITQLVEAAVAKATAPLQEQLTKAMAAPAPGGPVLTRTVEDTTKASAREGHLNKAAEYNRLAFEVQDSATRDGYLQLAAEARAAATS